MVVKMINRVAHGEGVGRIESRWVGVSSHSNKMDLHCSIMVALYNCMAWKQSYLDGLS